MFYLKENLRPGVTIKIDIREDNVFTVCPLCGGEHQILNLQELITFSKADMFRMKVHCPECRGCLGEEDGELPF